MYGFGPALRAPLAAAAAVATLGTGAALSPAAGMAGGGGGSGEKLRKFRPSMPLETASSIIDESIKLARQHDILPLAVVVLDAGGQIVAGELSCRNS
mmetsp:Transcript_79480/g.226944  ORF Transcript_79480/g.226944 Transcript_79480/m.226944 type:complete len:97 (+) Transcript_79480:108-398(+)